MKVVVSLGFEPKLPESKSGVLPLHHETVVIVSALLSRSGDLRGRGLSTSPDCIGEGGDAVVMSSDVHAGIKSHDAPGRQPYKL